MLHYYVNIPIPWIICLRSDLPPPRAYSLKDHLSISQHGIQPQWRTKTMERFTINTWNLRIHPLKRKSIFQTFSGSSCGFLWGLSNLWTWTCFFTEQPPKPSYWEEQKKGVKVQGIPPWKTIWWTVEFLEATFLGGQIALFHQPRNPGWYITLGVLESLHASELLSLSQGQSYFG